jgi:DNA primase
VVSTYIRLEKSGAQFRARCPFHNEKTPSFYVSPERKSFHCFGCQTHGDIFTFVEKIENIPFYEALKILADRAGVSLKDSQRNKEETQLISLLKDATEHFEKNLQTSPEAKQYLAERGLTEQTLQTFHIGYAKNEWRDLFIYLASRGYSPEEMEQAGLMIKTEKGYYDRFRGRVMFPIRNVSGATVGYSGRILPSLVDPSIAQGKYVNTPETVLYHKSKILFGYDTGKKMMQTEKEVIVVEGQMDLCMSYQAGIHNTVAVSGTAFTDEHIHIIKRFCDRVVLSFDTDQAGQNALKKSALLCLTGGLDVYVVTGVGTKDPADLILENRESWISAVKNRKHVVEAILENILHNESDERAKGRRIVTEVLPYVRAISSSIDRAHFIKVISQKASIPEDIITEELMRGVQLIDDVAEEVRTVVIPSKDRVLRELIAFVTLRGKIDHEEIIPLSLDMTLFPEEIIQEEMFKLEERMIGNEDTYMKDLIQTYKRELHKEKIRELQSRLRQPNADVDALMNEINLFIKGK